MKVLSTWATHHSAISYAQLPCPAAASRATTWRGQRAVGKGFEWVPGALCCVRGGVGRCSLYMCGMDGCVHGDGYGWLVGWWVGMDMGGWLVGGGGDGEGEVEGR